MTIQTRKQFEAHNPGQEKLLKDAAAVKPPTPETPPVGSPAAAEPVARPPLVPPKPAGVAAAVSPTVETPATTTTATAEPDPIQAAEAADAEAMKELAGKIRAASADSDLAALERLLR